MSETLRTQIKQAIVRSLRLPMQPAEIGDDTPLFGEGVDIEEWFHICGVDGPLAFDRWPSLPSRVVETTRRLLDLLARHDVRATFFVLGWVAERHPDLVREIASAGHEIGSHGHTHRRIYELNEQEFADELARCRL